MSSDSATITWGSILVRSRGGRYLAAPIAEDGLIARWNADGSPLPPIGRPGGGPGEFGAIRMVALTTGDSIVVLEHSRLTLLTPEGAYVRSERLPPGVTAFRFIVLNDGGVVLNNTGPGLPAFVELDAEFKPRRQFGFALSRPPAVGAVRDSLLRLLAVSPTGDIWAMPQRYQYALEHWSPDRERIGGFIREVDWFHAWTQAEYESSLASRIWETVPLPLPSAITVDSLGLVWTAVRVARRDWAAVEVPGSRQAAESPHGPIRSSSLSDPDPSRFVETMIEVVDPDRAELVRSARISTIVRGFLSPSRLAYSAAADADGLIHFNVVTLLISQPTGGDHN